MPGVFGKIGRGIDAMAEPLGHSINRLRLGSARAGHAPSSAIAAGGGLGSAIASAARASRKAQNIKVGRTAIGARSSFRWNWLRQQKKRSQRGI